MKQPTFSILMILMAPFVIQAVAIGFDEFIFHRKRGLPFWERIGHPLDTLTTILCLVFCLWKSFNPLNFKIYLGLSLFSALFITKDEWVHKDHCPASEMWLHALLFVNHGLQLTALGFLWSFDRKNNPAIDVFLWSQLSITIIFCLYQIIYWNFVWKKKSLTTTFTKN